MPERPRRVLRPGERRHDRRDESGRDLRPGDPVHRVRPRRPLAALLPPDRRPQPGPLAVGPDPRRRDAPSLVRQRQGGDRPHGRPLRRDHDRLAARDGVIGPSATLPVQARRPAAHEDLDDGRDRVRGVDLPRGRLPRGAAGDSDREGPDQARSARCCARSHAAPRSRRPARCRPTARRSSGSRRRRSSPASTSTPCSCSPRRTRHARASSSARRSRSRPPRAAGERPSRRAARDAARRLLARADRGRGAADQLRATSAAPLILELQRAAIARGAHAYAERRARRSRRDPGRRGEQGPARVRLRPGPARGRPARRRGDDLVGGEHEVVLPSRSRGARPGVRGRAQPRQPALGADRPGRDALGGDADADERARAGRGDVAARVRGLRLSRLPRRRRRGPGRPLARASPRSSARARPSSRTPARSASSGPTPTCAWVSPGGPGSPRTGRTTCPTARSSPARSRPRPRARSASRCPPSSRAGRSRTSACASRAAAWCTPRHATAATTSRRCSTPTTGARILGEFAFGLNYEIDRWTRNILFDEKIGGTVHLALGSSFEDCGGKNQSALHWDIICDLRTEGEIYADGELRLARGPLPGGAEARGRACLTRASSGSRPCSSTTRSARRRASRSRSRRPRSAAPLVREVYRRILAAGAHPLPRIGIDGMLENLMLDGSDDAAGLGQPGAARRHRGRSTGAS